MNFDFAPILNHAISRIGCSGALLALSENGAVQTFSGGVFSSRDHNRPYYIYSISKTFTAVAIMHLCESRGDFLDKTFSSFFPSTAIPREVTIRQLLNHTSGLSDYFSSSEYQHAVHAHPATPWSYERLMDVGLRDTPLFPPGEGWSYSNPAYGLLKELIELLSGMHYCEFLETVIIGPLDLSGTRGFCMPDTELVLLAGEDPSFESDFRPLYSPEWIATGCLISTTIDIARFYEALFSGKIVSEQSVREMKKTVHVPYPLPPPASAAYGLGLMHTRNDPLGDAYGHGGGGPGYTTYARHYPDLKGSSFTISLALNKTLPSTPFDLADAIARAYIENNG